MLGFSFSSSLSLSLLSELPPLLLSPLLSFFFVAATFGFAFSSSLSLSSSELELLLSSSFLAVGANFSFCVAIGLFSFAFGFFFSSSSLLELDDDDDELDDELDDDDEEEEDVDESSSSFLFGITSPFFFFSTLLFFTSLSTNCNTKVFPTSFSLPPFLPYNTNKSSFSASILALYALPPPIDARYDKIAYPICSCCIDAGVGAIIADADVAVDILAVSFAVVAAGGVITGNIVGLLLSVCLDDLADAFFGTAALLDDFGLLLPILVYFL